MNNISYSLINHRGAQRIDVSFEFNKEWNERISKVAGAKWSKSLQCWLIPDSIENRKKCNLKVDDVITLSSPIKNQTLQPNLNRINENIKEELNKFIKQLILKAIVRQPFARYISTAKLKNVQNQLNERPRHVLDYKTPKKVFEEMILKKII